MKNLNYLIICAKKIMLFLYTLISAKTNESKKLNTTINDETVNNQLIDDQERIMAKNLTLFDEFDFYKESYYHEIDLKEKLNSRITTLFSILPLLISVLLYFFKDTIKIFKKIDYHPLATFSYFSLLIILSIVFFLFLRKLYLSIHGHKYMFIATSKEINDYKLSLIKDYNFTFEEVDIEMKNFITETLIKSSTNNKTTNMEKSKYFKGNTNLICIFLFFTILVFFSHMYLNSTKIPDKHPKKSNIILVEKI